MSTDLAPTVAVIVPVYNGAATIAVCLESLLQQIFPESQREIVVVDDGSTDDTPKIVRRYPVRLLQSERGGPAAARNLGIARSEGDVVAFTDADCIADPRWLSELLTPYADPVVGGVGGQILAYSHPDRTRVERFSEEQSPLVNFVSGEAEFLPHLYTANASYRRAILDQLGGFNADLLTAEDVDLAWRAQLETGVVLKYVDRAVVYHHHRSTRAGLAKQYRQYGFGEILLDTLYGAYPDYPRDRQYQVRRLLHQIAALPRYAGSILIRRVRFAMGRISSYHVVVPELWFLIESNNIRGKIEGLIATRWMRDKHPALTIDKRVWLSRFFPDHKC